MEYTGRLITGDFEENTMTFEIEGEMTLQAGRYKIIQIEVGNQVKNNVDLSNVSGRFNSDNKEENKKVLMAILYKHTYEKEMKIREVDYEEVVKDIMEYF